MESLLLGLLAFVVVITVLAVGVPLALCYLLVRVVRRSPAAARLRRVAGVPQPAGRTPPAAVGRQWRLLVADAEQAARRFHDTVGSLAPGPLRDRLEQAAVEVDAAVVDARRVAGEGSRADRAHREVVAALNSQRRRRPRTGGLPPDLAASLDAATQAQHSSAERLATATRRDLCRLQLIVARLHELTAHTLELATVSRDPLPPVTVSIADHLDALRQATAELDAAVAV